MFTAFIALAALAPVIYTAITLQSSELATGAGAGVLAVAGAVTRVIAIPGVENFLQRFVPWMAASEGVDLSASDSCRSVTDRVPPDGE